MHGPSGYIYRAELQLRRPIDVWKWAMPTLIYFDLGVVFGPVQERIPPLFLHPAIPSFLIGLSNFRVGSIYSGVVMFKLVEIGV